MSGFDLLVRAPKATSASVAGTRIASLSFRAGSKPWPATCVTSGTTSASKTCHSALKLKNGVNKITRLVTSLSVANLCASVGRSTNSGTSPASRPGGQICRKERIRSSSPMTCFLSSVSLSLIPPLPEIAVFAHPSLPLSPGLRSLWKSARLFMLSTCKTRV